MRIALVNMPFSSLQIPSIALHQLETVIKETEKDILVDVHYLNHDFGALFGPDMYAWISESLAGHTCGFGEWLFRQVAFPEHPDNMEEYFARYQYHFGADQVAKFHRELAPLRKELPGIIDGMITKYGLADADIVGLTSMFFQNNPSFALARRLKDMGSNALTLMGGANCEGNMGIEIVNNVHWIDYVFSGHALVSFPQFVAALRDGDRDQMAGINGVLCRENCKSIAELPEEIALAAPGKIKSDVLLKGIDINAPERSLSKAVDLDYDGYLKSYNAHFGSHRVDEIELLFETSRGCWWGEKAHCTFCGLNGASMNFREMGSSAARQTIESLISRYSDRVKRFASVDNIIPKPYIDKLLPDLKVPGDVSLFYEVRADLRPDQLKVLAKARVVEIQPGVESIATDTLKLMKKGTTAFNNIRFLADCSAHEIKPIWNLLVGFPGEPAETFEMYHRNLPLLVHLPPPSGVFPVRFDRFSPYFVRSDDFNLDLEPLDYHELNYPFSSSVIKNMAYYFRDRNVDAQYQKDLAAHLTRLRAVVSDWRERWLSGKGKPRLRLVEDKYGWLIQDQRKGQTVEHELTNADVELLRQLSEPLSIKLVRDASPDSYDYLNNLGVIFEERGRAMSLVMEGVRYAVGMGNSDFGGSKSRAEVASLSLTF